MRSVTISAIILSLFITSCSDESETDLTNNEASNEQMQLFTLLNPEESGFYFLNELSETETANVITYENYYNGAGVGVGDINNDGLPDLFLTGNSFGGRLYLNKGNLKFEQISESANIFTRGFTTDVAFVDINGDGYQDIYLSRSLEGEPSKRANILYINNGDNTFTDKAEEYGIADTGYTNQSLFFDYDNDGDLDLYVLNHRVDFNNALTIFDTKEAKGNVLPPSIFWNDNYSDKLYENNGDQTFTNVSLKAGIINSDFSLSTVASDLNGDGWVDLYVANDFSSKDHAYINQGDGTFKDELEDRFGHTALSSMGLDIADINNDGNSDLVNVDMAPEGNYRQKQLKRSSSYDKYHLAVRLGFYHQISRNMLQLNNGDGTFSEIGQLANIAYTDWSWSPLIADFDNDGQQDLFISNGHSKDITDSDYLKYKSVEAVEAAGGNDYVKPLDLINLMTSTKISNYMYANNGNLGFENKTQAWGLDQLSHSNGSAYADLDLDGDLDLIVNNFNQESFLYRNNSREINKMNYLSVVLKGEKGNPQGFGAKLKIETDDGILFRECTPYRGFLSSVDQVIHFGIGNDSTIKSLEVAWPNGKKQTLKNVAINQRLEVDIVNAKERVSTASSTQETMFEKLYRSMSYVHKENPFIDFKQEPLLEHMLSNKGPVLASEDINNDGLKDLFIGGSAGEEAQLLIQKANGQFTPKKIADFAIDKAHEDAGCLFVDVNGDQYLDLYVSSGSNEFDNGSIYQDRIYINDGKGNFKKDIARLPKITSSTSCVLSIDYDKDGDQDLFVGGYAKKNAYPKSEKSWLLRNDNGHYKDMSSLLPENGALGIVNDAVALSSNQLVIVGEWMEITLLKKDKSSGFKKDKNNGLDKTGGWWNSIEACDFDEDGDLDFVVGNRGLNTMFKPTTLHPAQIFWGDFDNNKDLDAIPCYYNSASGARFPKHGLDQLFMQMKGVRRTFPDYESYSRASLETIIPDRKNSLTADMFESVYVENLGNGKMKVTPLPIHAQFSFVQDILARDVDSDGKKDIILVGNNYGVDIENGRCDASHGLVLINAGKGKFIAQNVGSSGFSTKGLDTRKIVAVSDNVLVVSSNNGPLQFFKQKKH
jgi:hypothetical protein